MDPCVLSDSELRDLLERKGIATHAISDRKSLEQMFHEVSYGAADGAAGGGGCRGGARRADGVVLDDEISALQKEVEKLRRIEELRAELAQLRVPEIAQIPPAAVGQAQAAQAPAVAAAQLPAAAAHGGAPGVQQLPAVPPQPAFVVADDVTNKVEAFSGDDRYTVQAFINNLEEAAVQFGWTAAQQFMYAKRLLKGTAKTLLSAIDVRTWADLRRELQAEFGPAMSISAVHKALASRRKQITETAQQYSIAMRQIAAMAVQRLDERDLVSYIVDGMAQDKSDRLFFAGATTLNELRVLMMRYKETIGVVTAGVRTTSPALARPNPFSGPTSSTATAARPRCYNCQEEGHFASTCKKPRRSAACFACGQEGHVQSLCPRRQTPKPVGYINVDDVWQKGYEAAMVDARTIASNGGVVQDGRLNASVVGAAGCQPHTDQLAAQQVAVANCDESAADRLAETSTYNNNFVEKVSLFILNGTNRAVVTFKALLDTGSPACFVQAKFIPAAFLCDSNPNEKFTGLNGSPLCVLGTVCAAVSFRGQRSENVRFFVVKDGTMQCAAILGRSFMQPNCLRLLKETATSELRAVVDEIYNINMCDNAPTPEYEVNKYIPNAIQLELKELIDSCARTQNNFGDEPSNIRCAIRLAKDQPFHCAPRRLSYDEKNKVRVILDDLLEQKVIRPSQSQYCSPIVLVKKKDGIRMCVDYRTLNKHTVRDNYPLPVIEDQMDLLSNKRYFSCLDLKSGFHHVSMAEDSVPLTAFVTPHGQFEYLRMPFGLKNAPSVFQRFINAIFRSLIDNNKIMIYMDDIMVATDTLEGHFEILEEVFQLIKQHGLQLKMSKCKFFLQEVDYLGYRVDSRGIRPNPENLEAVRGFPMPNNVRDVHSFLGLCSYFRKFIKNFATIARPLYDLLKKESVFRFGDAEKEVFEFLKMCLLDSPVLSIYSPDDETELHCDASALGYGAILLQRKADNQFHPVFYFSKKTTEAESRYHSFELETLAIVNALKRFRVYLEGIAFKIVTDCNSLTLTLNKKQINPRIARWALELENFNYSIEHRPNQRMRHVDSLSRIPEVAIVEQISFEQLLAVEQGRDHNIVKIRESLESATASASAFELIDGLVYRKLDDKSLFYVPSLLESNVIRANHDDCGHFGPDKVHDRITRTYWFPHIRKKVQAYIRSCLKCVQFSPNSGKIEGDLHSIPKGKLPFHTVHIDHLGPLSTTKQKHKHILVIVDGFTKFVKLYPVRSTSSKETINRLTAYFNAYSRPVRIISDRGTAFTSAEFTRFLESNNIVHIKIATASPQSNGQVERFNRILIPLLAKISNGDDWDRKLIDAEFAINNTKNRSVGTTPSILLFGIDQRGAVNDKIRDYLSEQVGNRDLEKIREVAEKEIEKSQAANKAAFNSSHKAPQKYNVDDLVMVSNYDCTPGVNKKLLPKYRGPYRVAQVLPNDRYIVTDVDNWQVTQRTYSGTHAPAQMRLWVGNPE